MAETPLFSIVIPCCNYGHWLPRAVNSVLAQDGSDWELLVINDGSTDTTDAVATELLHQHQPRLRYLAQANRGVAATRNRGIDATTGRYLIFLDADDEMTPGALGVYREVIARHPGVDMVAGGYRVVDADGRERRRQVGSLPRSPRRRLQRYLFTKKLHFSNGAVAIRREVFAVRRYPEHLRAVEDIPVFAYLMACRQLAVTPAPLAIIHRHAGSLRHNAGQAAAAGMALVDELFRPGVMPDWAVVYRAAYETQRCLSLFRTCYLAGERNNALGFYHRALREDPVRTLSRWSYLRKYLSLRLGLHRR
ncbi:MAG: glycosyltransferase family 2 protein [Gammaproteobacteria bacterium]|nr:glycosyltransferase family 2 protein [Gammaproteobacteria bacterium]